MWYFNESRIQESILEMHLVEKDQIEEVNDEELGVKNEEIIEEKNINFEAQDPFMEVNLGIEEKP